MTVTDETAPVAVARRMLIDGRLTAGTRTFASVNPATALLQAGRGFISGVHQTSGLAFLCGAGLLALMGVYALRGLRSAERDA